VSTNALFSEERRARILELIRQRKKLTVHELCDSLQVSPATVRGDLRDLDREGLLVRTHGGVLEKSQASFEQTSSKRSTENLDAKRSIAIEARTLVEDGDTILLDTGTTTLELAYLLKSSQHLTVVTNDLEIARVLEDASGIQVVFLGGTLRKGYHCTIGPVSIRMLQDLCVDKAFMATNSLSLESGATTPDIHQAETKRAMIAAAREVVMLCDSSKIGRDSFARFVALDKVDVLITERMCDDDRRRLEEHGTKVFVAHCSDSRNTKDKKRE
jgi:DeoR family transcriptional regulator, fructose operon transcriptional repressor